MASSNDDKEELLELEAALGLSSTDSSAPMFPAWIISEWLSLLGD